MLMWHVIIGLVLTTLYLTFSCIVTLHCRHRERGREKKHSLLSHLRASMAMSVARLEKDESRGWRRRSIRSGVQQWSCMSQRRARHWRTSSKREKEWWHSQRWAQQHHHRRCYSNPNPPHPHPQPTLLVFSSETAFNGIVEELKNFTTHVAHVLPISDDGGSTGEIVSVLGTVLC